MFVAFRAPAERPDVEINVAIKNLRKLSGEFGAFTGTIAAGDVSEVEVSPDTPVSTLVPASGAQLKPGATLTAIAVKHESELVATFVSVQ